MLKKQISKPIFSLVFTLFLSFCLGGCSSSSKPTLTLKGSTSAATPIKLGTHSALATTSPTSVKVKVYELWVSTSQLCTDPIQVFQNDTPEEQDMVSNPTFGEGSIDSGTYECLIIVMSDVIKGTPADDVGTHCQAGVEISGDICNDGTTSLFPDGATTTCTDSEDKIASYLSTAVTVNLPGDAGFNPPDSVTSPTSGSVLTSPLVVEGDKTLTMYIDFTDKISDNGTNCEMGASPVGFR